MTEQLAGVPYIDPQLGPPGQQRARLQDERDLSVVAPR